VGPDLEGPSDRLSHKKAAPRRRRQNLPQANVASRQMVHNSKNSKNSKRIPTGGFEDLISIIEDERFLIACYYRSFNCLFRICVYLSRYPADQVNVKQANCSPDKRSAQEERPSPSGSPSSLHHLEHFNKDPASKSMHWCSKKNECCPFQAAANCT
jgi:hypothetical protein